MTEPSEIVGGVPVFRPSMAQFEDFYGYMKSINKYGMQSGIAKVVPPQEWLDSLPEITSNQLQSIKIRNPITQHINGSSGVYAQQNIEKMRTYNIVQWKALSEQANFQPPAQRGKNRKSVSKEQQLRNKQILANKNHSDPQMFKDFEYNIDTSEFTDKRCEQLEKVYWKGLMYSDPMYGADMLGSIFDDSVKSWNVAHLPNVLDYMEEKLPGVNDAYLYAGLWKATFSWHLEDQDLYSINYLHFGAPKQWYSIPQGYKDKFDVVMRDLYPEEYQNCPDFLRHKTFLVSPTYLESKGVKVNRIIHREREFMITYPFGYHAGMNFGYNVAESVNFALDDWFEYGLKTSKCLCIADSVGINVPRLMRKFKGEPEPEPEPESEEEESSDLQHEMVSPGTKTISDTDTESRPSSGVELFNECLISSSPKKKRKLNPDTLKREESPQIPEDARGIQCYLCPNKLSKKQLKFDDFRLIPIAESMETKRIKYCHKLCANMIHETSIKQNPTEECIIGFNDIPNARKKLKCLFCHEKNGACFQCSAPKCTRSFHATCALPAGVYFNENGEQYCKIHRNKENGTTSFVSKLNLGDIIQAKFTEYFAGSIISKNKSEGSVTINLYPLTDMKNYVEVPFDNISAQGIRFTKTALKKQQRSKSESNMDEIQLLNLKDPVRYSNSIEDFNDSKMILEKILVTDSDSTPPPNGETQLWYYKPLKSTEATARYADDINKDEPNDPNTMKKKTRAPRSRKKVKDVVSLNQPIPNSLLNNDSNYSLSSMPLGFRPIAPQVSASASVGKSSSSSKTNVGHIQQRAYVAD